MKATLVNGVLLAGLSLLVTPACSVHAPGAYYDGDGYGDVARGQRRAWDRGYHHGVKAGVKDRERHRRFDPWRHHQYRDADSGYSSRYGPRPSYSRTYRDGFRAGYEEGYGRRGGRYGRDGRAVPRR
jgi:hypothetical protein